VAIFSYIDLIRKAGALIKKENKWLIETTKEIKEITEKLK